jgi:hypothetical protein
MIYSNNHIFGAIFLPDKVYSYVTENYKNLVFSGRRSIFRVVLNWDDAGIFSTYFNSKARGIMDEGARIAQFLYVVLAMRDGETVVEEDMSEDFTEGYRQAMDDLAQWLIHELALPKQAIKRIMAP